MKKNANQLLIVLLFPFMGLYLFSCIPDNGTHCPDQPATVKVDLPKYEKDKIPYTGKDTLMFIRKTIGDTHTFIGQGMKSGYDLKPTNIGDAECRSTQGDALMEFVKYTFVSSTFNSPIVLQMYHRNYPVNSWIEIRFNNKMYETPAIDLSNPLYDSIQIGNKMCYNANRFADDLYPDSKDYYVFYNAKYGILKFRFQTGEEWELHTKP